MSARLLFTLKQCRGFSVSTTPNHLRQEETGITVRTMIVTISSSNKSLHINSSSSVSPFKNCKNNRSIKIWFEHFSLLGFAVGREGGRKATPGRSREDREGKDGDNGSFSFTPPVSFQVSLVPEGLSRVVLRKKKISLRVLLDPEHSLSSGASRISASLHI